MTKMLVSWLKEIQISRQNYLKRNYLSFYAKVQRVKKEFKWTRVNIRVFSLLDLPLKSNSCFRQSVCLNNFEIVVHFIFTNALQRFLYHNNNLRKKRPTREVFIFKTLANYTFLLRKCISICQSESNVIFLCRRKRLTCQCIPSWVNVVRCK